jgi:CRISPR system Cascade subunit CasE
MYLTRLIIDPRSRDVQRDLADCQRLHQRVMSLFPDVPQGAAARARLGVLYRLDAHPRTGSSLLVQSRLRPAFHTLPSGYLLDTGDDPPNPQSKPVEQLYAGLRRGMVLRFRLRANPTKKIDSWQGREGYRPNGRRVDLRREEDQIAWIQRKAQQHGFRILEVALRPDTVALVPSPPSVDPRPGGRVTGWREAPGSGRQRLTFAAVVYEGMLQITDAETFRLALADGIGPAKAYGFGLLSIMRPLEQGHG